MKINIHTAKKNLDKTCKRLLEDYLDCVLDSEIVEILFGVNGVTRIEIDLEEGDFNEEESPPED